VRDVGLLVTQTHGPDEACSCQFRSTITDNTDKYSRSYLTGRLVKSGPTNVG
jgi:hypothetical protein